ncbi:protein of unknown function [Streptomyces sp. KY75]|nr:protein of unknown function [Streptomyces sp. KY70]CAD5984620.1 protein of unknown function [Streptomyces sp. KY75]
MPSFRGVRDGYEACQRQVRRLSEHSVRGHAHPKPRAGAGAPQDCGRAHPSGPPQNPLISAPDLLERCRRRVRILVTDM